MITKAFDLTLPLGNWLLARSDKQGWAIVWSIVILIVLNIAGCLVGVVNKPYYSEVEMSRIAESVSVPEVSFLGVVIEPVRFAVEEVTEEVEVADGVSVEYRATHVLSYLDKDENLRSIGLPSDGEAGNLRFTEGFLPAVGDEIWLWMQIERGQVKFFLSPDEEGLSSARAARPIAFDPDLLTYESLIYDQSTTKMGQHFWGAILTIVGGVVLFFICVYAEEVNKEENQGEVQEA